MTNNLSTLIHTRGGGGGMTSTMLFMNNPTMEKDGVSEMSGYNFWLMNKMPTLEMLLLAFAFGNSMFYKICKRIEDKP